MTFLTVGFLLKIVSERETDKRSVLSHSVVVFL